MSDRGGELGRAAGRAGALGLLRAAPRGPAPAAGRARRPAPTGERPAAFSATCLPGPSVAPIPLSLLFLPPPQLRGRAGGEGERTAQRGVSSPPAPPAFGAGGGGAALSRGPSRAAPGTKTSGCAAPPTLVRVESGGHTAERPPLWGSLPWPLPRQGGRPRR